jgi:putative ABC transport system permease protein
VVLINLPKRSNGKPSNVTVRGTSALACNCARACASSRAACSAPAPARSWWAAPPAAFAGATLGASLRFAGRDWLIVGRYDSGRSGLRQRDLGRRRADGAGLPPPGVLDRRLPPGRQRGLFDSVKDRIDADPRLKLEAKPEIRFYAEQSEALATFINILGLSLAVIFSIGAVVGAMITMFAAVAQRTGEIGTLRALGFRRGAVLAAFLAGKPAAVGHGRRGGPGGGQRHAGGGHVDHQLPDLQPNWPSASC